MKEDNWTLTSITPVISWQRDGYNKVIFSWENFKTGQQLRATVRKYEGRIEITYTISTIYRGVILKDDIEAGTGKYNSPELMAIWPKMLEVANSYFDKKWPTAQEDNDGD